ncbi:hypothetical protein PQ478_08485 [Alkalihalophilus pseudofirmus]|uniref:hypothetical protein n=1 Tax=Alkalihalophilus pseudofirmus TaxID=79885 RepID=UPI00259B88A9|nr:hypothetical protein [Alkalihalophilus pseudofirmus]WEG18505.1 hypothetical protein PQ478_08485 [Alkalihalophilus pseudofirmus]
MPTRFQEVYSRFLQKIQTWSFVDVSDEQMEDELEGWLMSAIPHFLFCRKDLYSNDTVLKQFNEKLDGLEIEILSILMLIEYLSPKLNTDELVQQSMSSKDYKLYSQANHIREIRELRDNYKNEVESLVSKYSYHGRDLNDFK